MSLPAWLVEKMRADNPDGVTRAARLGTCGQCGGPVLRGLDDDRCAAAVEVTPIELDHFGEYLAIARGCLTYYLAKRSNTGGAPRWELDPRYLAHVQRKERRYPVVPQHRCGIWLPHWKDGLLQRWNRPAVDTAEPPF